MEGIKFTERVPFVLNKDLLERIDDFVAKNGELYNSRSHFLRAAAIRLLKEK